MLLLFISSIVPFPVAVAGEEQSIPEFDVLAAMDARRQALAERMEKATLLVIAFDSKFEGFGMGSGFVVGDGFVMTNAHVVDKSDPDNIFVVNEHYPLTRGKLIKMSKRSDDHSNDFALVRVFPEEKNGATPPVLPFNLDIKRMDRVSAWGFPGVVVKHDVNYRQIFSTDGINSPPVVFTEGAVSALVRKPQKHIIHTAHIAQGNSGGPLVNQKGEVVGINTWGDSEFEGGAGVVISASLASEDVVAFLRENGVEPVVVKSPSHPLPQQRMPTDGGNTLPELEARAHKGDAEAQYLLAISYLNGEDGFEEDEEKAFAWLERAADNEYPDALGMMALLAIIEDESHTADAATLLRRAAGMKGVDPVFKSFLSDLLYYGETAGVPRNPEEALKWAKEAAKEDAPRGLAQVALHLYFGTDGEEDHKTALRLARQALKADPDEALAKAVIAHIYYDGEIVRENLNMAWRMASEAAEEEEGLAEGLVAIFHADGLDPVEQDYEEAAEWARRAADHGDMYGQNLLGRLYKDGLGVEKDPVRAWAYLTLAFEKIDSGGDDDLEELENEMSNSQLRRAQKLLKSWREEWGLPE